MCLHKRSTRKAPAQHQHNTTQHNTSTNIVFDEQSTGCNLLQLCFLQRLDSAVA
jgi:hypothetical protein